MRRQTSGLTCSSSILRPTGSGFGGIGLDTGNRRLQIGTRRRDRQIQASSHPDSEGDGQEQRKSPHPDHRQHISGGAAAPSAATGC